MWWSTTSTLFLAVLPFLAMSLNHWGTFAGCLFQQSASVCPLFLHDLHFFLDPVPDPTCLAVLSRQFLHLCPAFFLQYLQTPANDPFALSVLTGCIILSLLLSEHGVSPWHRPKIYSTVVRNSRLIDTLNFFIMRCKTPPNISMNPTNSQNRFITQEDPIGTKYSMSLTNGIRATPDVCRIYTKLFQSSVFRTKTVPNLCRIYTDFVLPQWSISASF